MFSFVVIPILILVMGRADALEERLSKEAMLKEAMLKEAMLKEAMLKEAMLKKAMLMAQQSLTPCLPLDMSNVEMDEDQGFGLEIGGHPDAYLPGQLYTVRLTGMQPLSESSDSSEMLSFVGFELRVLNEASRQGTSMAAGSAGSYQLLGDVFTRFSDHCTNTVIHTSDLPKREIQVLWTAPMTRSGCVLFLAAIEDSRGRWARHGGRLSLRLCEHRMAEHRGDSSSSSSSSSSSTGSECCACEEAKYELSFEGLWSKESHPKDFPSSQFLLHFSDLIGASHTADYRVWEYNGYASKGLEQVAKWGSTRLIESELKLRSDHIRTIIKARGLWYPNVNGRTFAVFRTDNRNHLVSIVSMLGPSPDWIVGVSGLDLCLSNCSWVSQKELFLYPWDAGVDDGITYEASDQPSFPHTPITRITSRHPDDPRQPFFDASGQPMLPVAKLSISRQRLYSKTCQHTHSGKQEDQEARHDQQDDEGQQQPHEDRDAAVSACAVSEWSAWSECNNCLDKHGAKRTRSFVMEDKANMMQCQRQLQQTQGCPNCPQDVSEDVCDTTDWSEWSECSATCGRHGVLTRQRNFKHRMGSKKCGHLDVVQRRPCPNSLPICVHSDAHAGADQDQECGVTSWSAWSPCSVTCGRGSRVRTRLELRSGSSTSSLCNLQLMEKSVCTAARRTCSFDADEARLICTMDKEEGPCRGFFPRWYFDHEHSGRCEHFVYGGCRGNSNNFESYDDCMALCFSLSRHGPSLNTSGSQTTVAERRVAGLSPRALSLETESPVDCLVTAWSPWSECSATCGNRVFRSQFRVIKRFPSPSGHKCPRRLRRRRNCQVDPCPDKCPTTDWTEWSPCSKTCGNDGVQQRTRLPIPTSIVFNDDHDQGDDNQHCPPLLEQRVCRLEECLG